MSIINIKNKYLRRILAFVWTGVSVYLSILTNCLTVVFYAVSNLSGVSHNVHNIKQMFIDDIDDIVCSFEKLLEGETVNDVVSTHLEPYPYKEPTITDHAVNSFLKGKQ